MYMPPREFLSCTDHTLAMCLSGSYPSNSWADFSEAEWKQLANVALVGGVAPLLHWAINQNDSAVGVPASISNELERAYYTSLANNLLLQRELGCILNSLERAGIPTIILKGAALAETLYPDIATRPMNDLDLLTRQSHLEKAVKVIEAFGYIVQKTSHHVVLQGGPGNQVTIELHWNLLVGARQSSLQAMSWFWQHAVPAQIAHRHTQILDTTAQLLYLSAHLMIQHARDGGRLMWFYDLHRLVTCWGEKLDWENLTLQAHELGWDVPLFTALLGCRQRFGTPLPEDFLSIVPQDLMNAFASNESPGLPIQNQAAHEWIWHSLVSLEGRARLHMIRRFIFPTADYMCWRYQPHPVWLWPACYPLRWWDLLRGGVALFKP